MCIRDRLYAHVSGGMKDVSGFSVHPFEAGDYILQEVPVRHPRITEYALVHRIADAVYQVIAIDEADADEATRTAHCGKGGKTDASPCRIATRDQLFDFARATAARRKDDGGLVLRLPDGAEKRPPNAGINSPPRRAIGPRWRRAPSPFPILPAASATATAPRWPAPSR